MKLFKDDYTLIFKYYNILDDKDINNFNVNLNINNNSNTNSPHRCKRKTLNQKDPYFTIDEIEKGIPSYKYK